MKYIYISVFLFTHDLTFLKKCWEVEFLDHKKFTWLRLLKRVVKYRKQPREFYFWWRLANEMYHNGNSQCKKTARTINQHLIRKYNTDIELGVKIGCGLHITHFIGIAINRNSVIGDNCRIHQFVTIGMSKSPCSIKIGHNVTIYTSSIIIGGNIKIGDNVKIGAMSFINKDIQNNCTVYTKKENIIICDPAA